MTEELPHSTDFYISQYRKMFKRIMIIYILIIICIGYVFYQLATIQEPAYYAASESGLLRKLDAWNEKDIKKFMSSVNK